MERIGPYEVHGQLGRGGMGVVFRAVDARDGQQVALKLLTSTDDRARRRLAQEAKALATLRHPNVVSILDVGEDHGRPWLAIELVRGRSLQERLDREGPLTPRDAARLVVAVAQGLEQAHHRGVLHRDLKPANVLLPDDGSEPKLTDFGLAGFTLDLEQSRLTKSGTLMGSPGYWSPEQASGKASSIGPATDVYGLGALLYGALTGRAPIAGESLVELLVAMQEPPEPLRTDPALDAIAMRCLEKRPEDRYPTVDAVAWALWQYLLAPAPSLPRARSTPRLLVGGGLAAGILGAVGLLLATWASTTNATRPTPPAPTTSLSPPPPPPATSPPALTDDQTHARAEELTARGLASMRTGDHAGALLLLDRAIELDPTLATAYATRAEVRVRLGDPEGAIADLDRAIELVPDNPEAHTNRGLARVLLKYHRGALRDFDRAIELAPGDPVVHTLRGNAKMRLEDYRGAIEDYDRVIELAPGDADVHASRGFCRAFLTDHDGAATDFETALQLQPDATWAAGARRFLANRRAKQATPATE